MSNRVLLDNWLLADVEDLLKEGVGDDLAPSLTLRPDGSSDWHEVPGAPLQVEALLRLLVAIVTRDELILEEKFRQTWGSGQSPLALLHEGGLVSFQRVSTGSDDVRPLRDRALEAICVTERLKQEQQENEECWARDGDVPHRAHSMAVWGGAGYLARSHVLAAPYSGHPIREDVLRKTAFRPVVPDATGAVLQWLDSQRGHVFQAISQSGDAVLVGARLPAVAVEIIEAASSLEGLLPVALQVREKFAPFREWMTAYQLAAESEDPKALLKHQAVMRDVESRIARQLGADQQGSTSVSFSLKWLNLSIPLSSVRGRFGMRALLHDLVFTPRGHQSLRRLLRMLDADGSLVGQQIIARFGG